MLSSTENDLIWEEIYKTFKFKPYSKILPSYKIPASYFTVDISILYRDEYKVEEREWLKKDLKKIQLV